VCQFNCFVAGNAFAHIQHISINANCQPLLSQEAQQQQHYNNDYEVEGIDNASVIILHLFVGITAETVITPIITNSLNLVHTKK
jgi:hypothetical protein